jgi:tetratricopeptide (TPR) repeat protein
MKRSSTILFILYFIRISFSQDIDNYDDYFKALAFFEYKEYNSSADLLTKALAANKNDYHILMVRGETFYNLQKYDQAIADFKKAEESKPGTAMYMLACCYARLGQPNEAVKWLEAFLKSDSKHPESKIKLDKSFTGIENSEAWKKLWMKDWYTKHEQLLADAEYLMNNKKYNEAIDILDNLLEQRKRFHQAYYMRAKIYVLLKEDKHAIEDYDEAIRLSNKNPQYYTDRARAYYRLEKYRQCISDYKTALGLDPLNIKLYAEKGLAESKLKEYKKAVSDYELFLKYFNRDDETIYQTGLCYFDLKNYDKALEWFDSAIKINCGASKYFTGRAYTFAMKSDFKHAEDDFSMALDLTPKDAMVYYGRGMVRLYMNKNSDACRDFEKAANLGSSEAANQLELNCK